jgi:hypothetical protein
MKKIPCPRCGVPRAARLARIHETSAWHRNYARIAAWLAAGYSLHFIAAKIGVSAVRMSQTAREAGIKNGGRKKAA